MDIGGITASTATVLTRHPQHPEPAETHTAGAHTRNEHDSATVSESARAQLFGEKEDTATKRPAGSEQSTGTPKELDSEDRDQVRELANRDREVRAHEAAHKAAAGNLATGGATYTYQTGPDGKRYAVGGEVSVKVSEGRTPEETLARARQLEAAASAPTDPSAADRQIAARAAQMAASARAEMQDERAEEAATDERERPEAPAGSVDRGTELRLLQLGLTDPR